MRTKLLKIAGKQKDAILIAGGDGFKIYNVSGVSGWVLVTGRTVRVVAETGESFGIISKYVSLKYQPQDEQSVVLENFENFLRRLREAEFLKGATK